MIIARRCLVGTIVTVGVVFATAVAAVAKTYTLTIKRRETKSASFDQASYMLWSVRPQYSYVQMHADENGQWRPANPQDTAQAKAFKRLVKKEPKYQSANPFRGVIKFGSQEYAFALDAVPPPDAKARSQRKTDAGEGHVHGGGGDDRRAGVGSSGNGCDAV